MEWNEKKSGRQSFEEIWDRANRRRKNGGKKGKVRGGNVRMSGLRKGESVLVNLVPMVNRGNGVVLVDEDEGGLVWEVSQLGVTKLDMDEGETFYDHRERSPKTGSTEEREEMGKFRVSYEKIDNRNMREAKEAMRVGKFGGWN